jgi:hypothetical protein
MTTSPGGSIRLVSFMDKCYEKIAGRSRNYRGAGRGLDRRRLVHRKQLEGRLADMVQQANAQLQSSAPEAGVELSWQNYQRGVFSSHLQLVVKPVAGKENSWLAAGQSLVFDEVVDHGPFPLASLKSFKLAPAMASVTTTLVNNDASKGCSISPKATHRLPSIPALPTAATASRLSF